MTLTPFQRLLVQSCPLDVLGTCAGEGGGGGSEWGTAPVAGGALADHSGNGHTLTEVNTPTSGRASPQTKYGDGYDMVRASDEHLVNGDAALAQADGDLSMFIAFELDDLSSTQHFVSSGLPDPGNKNHYVITVFTDGQLRYGHQDAGGSFHAINSAAGAVSTGFSTFTLLRDTTAKTVVVKINGTEVINDTYSNQPHNDVGAEFYLGRTANQDSINHIDGGVYEARVWNDLLVSQTTLDKIADPADLDTQLRLEGNESACYFLETVS